LGGENAAIMQNGDERLISANVYLSFAKSAIWQVREWRGFVLMME
jgi:hypothetical protein